MSEECETCTNNVDGKCILDWGCCYTPKREEKTITNNKQLSIEVFK